MALIPMHELDALCEAGVHYPSTRESWRWLFRTRAERGVEDAFVRCGRRILVDTEVLLERMRRGGVPSGGGRPAAPVQSPRRRAGGV
jgi:hypothetical protein